MTETQDWQKGNFIFYNEGVIIVSGEGSIRMKLEITKEAVNWYKDELELQEGDYVRFYARYGGCGTVQKGFSLGLSLEEPNEPLVTTTEAGITFFIEEKDSWYFKDHNLEITYNDKYEEVEFSYPEK